jgi:1-acyl-sn-glycerol-3-phosphate acyltransferase
MIVYKLSQVIVYVFGKVWLRMSIYGKENIPEKGGFILASNHVSNLDPLLLGAICRRRMGFMAKEELFRVPGLCWWLKAIGAFPVKRNASDISSLKNALNILRQGLGLLVFPEGRREESGAKNIEVKGGVGFLSEKANVGVIPVYIQGTQQALPKYAKWVKPAKVSIFFGKEIPCERRLPYHDFAQKVMDGILQLSCSKIS